MLKNIPMRILAITFALSLMGCVDQVTTLGVDDIDENTDTQSDPTDTLKGDADPVGRPDSSPKGPPVGEVNPTSQQERLTAPARQVKLNAVPRR
jgi:hypothetical protein